MDTNNKISIKDLNILDGLGPVELLRIVFKSGGASAYLPKDIVSFLNLNEGSRSLVAFLDSEGSHNYLIIAADKSLVSLLKPIILARRAKAQQLQQELKMKLQAQQQAAETAQAAVSIDV